jgi:hypothetical protein
MHVYLSECMPIYQSACMSIYRSTCLSIGVHVYLSEYMHVYLNLCVPKCACIREGKNVRMYMHVCMYMYACPSILRTNMPLSVLWALLKIMDVHAKRQCAPLSVLPAHAHT